MELSLRHDGAKSEQGCPLTVAGARDDDKVGDAPHTYPHRAREARIGSGTLHIHARGRSLSLVEIPIWGNGVRGPRRGDSDQKMARQQREARPAQALRTTAADSLV
jgi:hypothetical protein